MRKNPPSPTCPHHSSMTSLLLGPINPGHSDVLKDDNDGERQGGRVVIEHGDEIVSGALDEQQPHEECKDTAAHYREPRGRCGGKGAGWVGSRGFGGPGSLPSQCSQAGLQPAPFTDSQAQPCRRALEAEVLSSPCVRQETLEGSINSAFFPPCSLLRAQHQAQGSCST